MSLTMSFPIHVPVLTEEALEGLQVQRGGCFIDCTVGLGGHAAAIMSRISPQGRLLAVDADPEAIRVAQLKLNGYSESVTFVNDNFANLEAICHTYNFYPVDGILFDLGVSSLQLDTAERGFSFRSDARLDMRFNPRDGLSAADVVNTFSERELAGIIREYGEDTFSWHIARHIMRNRPIVSTLQLAQIVEQALCGRHSRIHPATRTFMALRIAVNSELENLKQALPQAVNLLRFGGRLVLISYHSLEDRIVKQFMRREATSYAPSLKLISKKVIKPTPLEIRSNSRSRSAKMRTAERL